VVRDVTTDWLVAGSGAAGLTSAIVAHQLGGKVLVVEKEARYGGTTCKSGGVAWIPANSRQAQWGVQDSVEEGWTYLSSLIGDSVPEARLRAYAERAREMLDFMLQHSAVDFTPLPDYMDYYESRPGYKPGGRSMDPGAFDRRLLGDEARRIRDDYITLFPFSITVREMLRLGAMDGGAFLLGARLALRYWLDLPARLRGEPDRRISLGAGLVAQLRYGLLQRDVPLWLSTPVEELCVEDGRVTGALVSREGETLRVHARRGVLLATGGFARDLALRETWQQPPVSDVWSAAAPGATGDAVRLGQAVGAQLGFMGSAWWSPSYRPPGGTAQALISGKAYPGSIMVNRQGRRFTNEAQPYEDVVKDQYASEARGERAVPAWLIFDGRFRRRYAAGPVKPAWMQPDWRVPAAWFDSGLLTRADSLESLAEKLGIDAPGLLATVQRFNRHARSGEDPEFGRGATLHDRFYADHKVQPNPSLGPLEEAPFYALRIEAGDLDTKGGLACDEYGRVLDGAGNVITGLYAAGNASAAVMGDTYPGAGATIGSAMTFGYLAARHALGAEAGAPERTRRATSPSEDHAMQDGEAIA
jgi:3-oxosteroid 1-dehydrogenase